MNTTIISRTDAKKLGLTFYFTGKPCPQNHISKRYVSSCTCFECVRLANKNHIQVYDDVTKEYQKKYRIERLDKFKQYNKTYRQINPNYNKNWYISNSKVIQIYIKKYKKRWKVNNPHKIFEYGRLRDFKVKQSKPIWYEEDLVQQIYLKRDELNVLWDMQLEVDHIIPLNPKCRTVCGLHCWANLQLLDKSLNSKKNDSYQTDW